MIPLLVTMDLEYAYDHDENEQVMILDKLNCDMKTLGLPLTVFVTGDFAKKHSWQVTFLKESGNEIGCHGLEHTTKENYKKLSPDKVKNYLINIGKLFENIIKEKPVCFRGPGMSTSSVTQNELVKNGYSADFSVCSQRFDFFNSLGGDIRWLFAPRVPYSPSEKNPFSKGNLLLSVIPLSCMGVPFMSGILYLFGIAFMKYFFRVLKRESQKKGNPIVYLFHSYEFAKYKNKKEDGQTVPNKDKFKRPLLHKLYNTNRKRRYDNNLELLKYMLSFEDVRAFTGKGYLKYMKGKS
jgi:hypothetical protein